MVHGAAQLRSRWGKDGAQAILDACGTKVFLPGNSDPGTLELASQLSGTMAARQRGHEHDSRHLVMTPDMIRQLLVRRDGSGYALILRNSLSPVVGRPPGHLARLTSAPRLGGDGRPGTRRRGNAAGKTIFSQGPGRSSTSG